MTGIKITRNDMAGFLDQMKQNSGKAIARIYPMYQKFQTERFQTQNASEGNSWQSLTPKYQERKKRQFQSYPGSGTKMMIASGTLAGAVIGPGAPFSGVDRHRVLFKSYSMEISIEESGKNAAGKPFVYASFADEARPVMEFSDQHLQQMMDVLTKIVIGE